MFLSDSATFVSSFLFVVHPIHTEAVSRTILAIRIDRIDRRYLGII